MTIRLEAWQHWLAAQAECELLSGLESVLEKTVWITLFFILFEKNQ